jgi:hypothetical protein
MFPFLAVFLSHGYLDVSILQNVKFFSYKQVSVVPRFGSKQVSLYDEFNIETSNISKKMGYNES